mmetsp:Transcript_11485/g.70619  ORF Transcript_11485/g.70619 Transcript_11485/m.70619 type:complete len:191 (+) Transcript_11485:35-607(+)
MRAAMRACTRGRNRLAAREDAPGAKKGANRNVRAHASVATTDTSRSASQGADPYFVEDKRPIVLFDGVCNMCNGGVNFILDWDKNQRLRFGALQSEAGRKLLERCGRSPDDISSIVLVEEKTHHLKSDAILRIAQACDMPLAVASSMMFLFPAFFRDGVYDVVANNRYSVLGIRDTCRLSDDSFADRFVQ